MTPSPSPTSPPGAFLVYTSLPFLPATALSTLNTGLGGLKYGQSWWAGNLSPPFAYSEISNSEPQANIEPTSINESQPSSLTPTKLILPSEIVDHHRAHAGSGNRQFFVIIDSCDWVDDAVGMLVVNLDFEGWLDAVRMKAKWAGDAVLSVNVGSQGWEEVVVGEAVVGHMGAKREGNGAKGSGSRDEKNSKMKYVVYILPPDLVNTDQEEILEVMQGGLEGRWMDIYSGPYMKDLFREITF